MESNKASGVQYWQPQPWRPWGCQWQDAVWLKQLTCSKLTSCVLMHLTGRCSLQQNDAPVRLTTVKKCFVFRYWWWILLSIIASGCLCRQCACAIHTNLCDMHWHSETEMIRIGNVICIVSLNYKALHYNTV